MLLVLEKEITELLEKFNRGYWLSFVPAKDISYVLNYEYSLNKRKQLIKAIWEASKIIPEHEMGILMKLYGDHDLEIKEFIDNYKTYSDDRIESLFDTMERSLKGVFNI